MTARFLLRNRVQRRLADTITPVSVYLRLRDQFPQSFLLESTDNQPNKKSFSYICCDPIASIIVERDTLVLRWPDGTRDETPITRREQVTEGLQTLLDGFQIEPSSAFDFLSNGLFGYVAYDAIRYFEDIDLQCDEDDTRAIPDVMYHVFRYILAIDHYQNTLYLMENEVCDLDGKPIASMSSSMSLEALSYLIDNKNFPQYPFVMKGEEASNFDDASYMEVVDTCKRHVFRGDVFQVVPSRRFSQHFEGDEFNVYRALRSINPSPYLFYFDCGSFKIFGSSPEAQLVVRDGWARLFPIAGTYKRTGDEEVDEAAIVRLLDDPKENAEHVMLVDLARNDLSKHCVGVTVEEYKEVQRYSHVIHLTSQVRGQLEPGVTAVQLMADTFPMGTLSGAPKYRAMEIIDSVERGQRRAYGGAIGLFGFDGSCNHAIVIRSFLSKGNCLFRQAGGGVVADSVPADELQEVNNKLGALRAALDLAASLVS